MVPLAVQEDEMHTPPQHPRIRVCPGAPRKPPPHPFIISADNRTEIMRANVRLQEAIDNAPL